MRYGNSISSPSKASPQTSANDNEVPRRSGGVFTSRLGMRNYLHRSHRDGQEEEELGGLECSASYRAMDDTKDKWQELLTDASNAYDEVELSSESGKEEEGGLDYIAPDASMETKNLEGKASSENMKKLSKAKSFKRVVGTVLPKVEPLEWTTFCCLSVWCTIP